MWKLDYIELNFNAACKLIEVYETLTEEKLEKWKSESTPREQTLLIIGGLPCSILGHKIGFGTAFCSLCREAEIENRFTKCTRCIYREKDGYGLYEEAPCLKQDSYINIKRAIDNPSLIQATKERAKFIRKKLIEYGYFEEE